MKGERKVAIETGWIGANTKEQAEEILQTKFPGGRIIRVYEKILGMFAYEIDMPDKGAPVEAQLADREDLEPEDVFAKVEAEPSDEPEDEADDG